MIQIAVATLQHIQALLTVTNTYVDKECPGHSSMAIRARMPKRV